MIVRNVLYYGMDVDTNPQRMQMRFFTSLSEAEEKCLPLSIGEVELCSETPIWMEVVAKDKTVTADYLAVKSDGEEVK